MFKLDMGALRKAAQLPRPTVYAMPAAANDGQPLAKLAEIAISHDLLDARLMVAAMRVCDRHEDSDKARQDMREQILATPPHLRQDLLDHFNQQERKP